MHAETWTEHEVDLGEMSYAYYAGYDCLDRIARELSREEPDRFIIVTDDTVLALHAAELLTELERYAPVTLLSSPAGEAMKSLRRLTECLETALNSGATKRSLVVAFGGGVPGNLGGMVAGILFRGIRLAHVPTTTVAAMDSVISMKQAVNSSLGKNQLGCYLCPQGVYTDLRLLQTLPDRELRSGMCEALKNCLAIRPRSLGAFREVVARRDLASVGTLSWLLGESLAAKSAVMRDDPRERGPGLILEYGHTAGHAIELCDQQRRGGAAISHGEAVALGMLVAARVSAKLGYLPAAELRLHAEVVEELGVGAYLPSGVEPDCVLELMRNDNKRGCLISDPSEVPMVLLRQLGIPVGSRELPLTAVCLEVIEDTLAGLTRVHR